MTITSADALTARLAAETIVPLSWEEWESVAGDFEELERHATGVAGDLFIVDGPSGLAAVEQPTPGKRLVRALSSVDAAREFVLQRLAQYERMWDGCGCKIDYYG